MWKITLLPTMWLNSNLTTWIDRSHQNTRSIHHMVGKGVKLNFHVYCSSSTPSSLINLCNSLTMLDQNLEFCTVAVAGCATSY